MSPGTLITFKLKALTIFYPKYTNCILVALFTNFSRKQGFKSWMSLSMANAGQMGLISAYYAV